MSGLYSVTIDPVDSGNTELCSDDKETLDLWKRFRDLSIVEYEKLYRRLNVRFDVYGGESLVKEDLIMDSLEKLISKNLLTKKTERESRIGAAALAAETISDDQDAGDDDQAPDALALDFDQYNLGKPVVQKGGSCCLNPFCLSREDTQKPLRWYNDLHPSRHSWCSTTIPVIQV